MIDGSEKCELWFGKSLQKVACSLLEGAINNVFWPGLNWSLHDNTVQYSELYFLIHFFYIIRPNEMFPSVSPYMSEDDLVNHLRNQLQLVANQRGSSGVWLKINFNKANIVLAIVLRLEIRACQLTQVSRHILKTFIQWLVLSKLSFHPWVG